ncbi:hypothetical protein A8C56_07885 [Niabella ginsenosidivorans]|uniref:Fibronectin type-III domain-containing protein n=1 Tax=Niabella ginsenosidivorans TaxID=1176587 RepID=A0A1A9I2J2_9BACT|nr:PQQ-binding-like beta-propeller repeat protein [Niabella ginsenosidivorans]ANH80911.1 hypothetical protein A8C56_07885 [Niabella ginsenosidivorans]
MKTNCFILTITCIILLISCRKKDPQNQEKTPETEINHPPEDFVISIEQLLSNEVIISWSAAKDPDGDSVTYSVYIDTLLIKENVPGQKYELTSLQEQTTYSVKVIARDSKQNEKIATLSVTTPKYYLKYIKGYNFPPSSYPAGSIYSMIKTADNNYAIAGSTSFNGDGYQFVVLKVDSTGKELWKRAYGYQLGDSWNFKITASKDGLLLVGSHHVLKLDQNGSIIWYKTIVNYDNGDASSEIKSIREDSKGNIYLVGGRGSPDPDIAQESALTMLDKSGNIIWEKVFKYSYRSFFNDLYIDKNNTLFILGTIEINQRDDFWLLKTNGDGNEIWNKRYGDERYDFARQIIPTSDGNLLFAGYSWGYRDHSDGRVFKINPANGNEIWSEDVPELSITSICETKDSGFMATGSIDVKTTFDYWGLSKLDRNGSLLWQKSYNKVATFLRTNAILSQNDGGFMVAGNSAVGIVGNNPQIVIIKTDPEGSF